MSPLLLTLDFVGTYNLIFNVALFVEAGVANTLSLEGLSDVREGSPLRFVPLEPKLTIGGVIVWKRYRLLSRAAELFLEELRGEVESAPLR